MREDPNIVRLNIRHYKELLKLRGTTESRQRITKLLSQAEAQLTATEIEAGHREM